MLSIWVEVLTSCCEGMSITSLASHGFSVTKVTMEQKNVRHFFCGFYIRSIFIFALYVCPCSGLDGGPAGHARGRDPARARGPGEDQEALPEEENQAGGGLPRVPAGLSPHILMMKSTSTGL